MNKPFSASCENNKAPILAVLKRLLVGNQSVLEVGSGTGQHAVYFAAKLADISWQTSDQLEYHAGIQRWIDEANLTNLSAPLALNVLDYDWCSKQYDAVFTANTLHIMSAQAGRHFVSNVSKALRPEGLFIMYGPFNYNGAFSSDSNARFNEWLKVQNADSAIRDFEIINQCATQNNLSLLGDYAMPANNRILAWRKEQRQA